jgi:hypothetical protein
LDFDFSNLLTFKPTFDNLTQPLFALDWSIRKNMYRTIPPLLAVLVCLLLSTSLGCISFSSPPDQEEQKDAKPEQLSADGGEEIRRKEERGKLVSGENAEVGGEAKEDLPQLNDAFVKVNIYQSGCKIIAS